MTDDNEATTEFMSKLFDEWVKLCNDRIEVTGSNIDIGTESPYEAIFMQLADLSNECYRTFVKVSILAMNAEAQQPSGKFTKNLGVVSEEASESGL